MQPTRLFDILDYQENNFPQEVCLAEKQQETWKAYSTAEVARAVNSLSACLIDLGVTPGDKVGIVSYNCPAWLITDLAILQIGAMNVPMYPNATTEDYAYIIDHAEIKLVFAGDEEIREKLAPIQGIQLFTFTRSGYGELLERPNIHSEEIAKRRKDVHPDDVASIIYTSGTTGRPKGVMLTHDNILSNVLSIKKILDDAGGRPGDKMLSFLPLSHIFERTGSYLDLISGFSIYFAESIDKIGDNIREVNPHFLRSVPRLLEKIYEKIIAKGHTLTGLKKQLFFWAVGLAEKYSIQDKGSLSYRIQLAIADKLILSKWREALGGQVKLIFSGAASLRASLVNIFWAAKIPILEGYGLTETSPVVTASRFDPDAIRAGAVGIPIENVEVRLAEDGEILVKGPNVMKGYYLNQEATDEVIKDGWFHTGDIGSWEEGRFLKITDRKKEIFKTSGGKYIAPQPIEIMLKESQYIEQAMVVGEYQKFPAALISPAREQLASYLNRHDIRKDQIDLDDPEVIALYQREVDRANEGFAQFEKIKKFRLVPGEWDVESGLVTPTLKLKRRAILQKYEEYIRDIYDSPGDEPR